MHGRGFSILILPDYDVDLADDFFYKVRSRVLPRPLLMLSFVRLGWRCVA